MKVARPEKYHDFKCEKCFTDLQQSFIAEIHPGKIYGDQSVATINSIIRKTFQFHQTMAIKSNNEKSKLQILDSLIMFGYSFIFCLKQSNARQINDQK